MAKNTDVLVIGNGCDMFLGLDSSFHSFFKNKYSKLSNFIKYFTKYENNFNKRYDIYYLLNYAADSRQRITFGLVLKYIDEKEINYEMGKTKFKFTYNNKYINGYINKYNNTNKLDYYANKVKKMLSEVHFNNINFWAIYFLLRKENGDLNWCDVESRIYDCIIHKNTDFYKLVSDLYELIKGKRYKFHLYNSENNYVIRKLFPNEDKEDVKKNIGATYTINDLYNKLKNKGFEYLLNNLDDYLIIYIVIQKTKFIENYSRKIDHNYKFFNNHKNLVNEDLKLAYFKIFNESIKFDNICKATYSFLKIQLSRFERDLNNYLQNKCLNDYKRYYGLSYYNIGRKLLDYMASNNLYSLIDFNYTNPILNAKNDSQIINKVSIHGSLINDNVYNYMENYLEYSPVIGISDRGLRIDDNRYMFTKNYRIMRLSYNNYKNMFYRNNKNKIRKLIFFGHSFDPADYSYFFDMFDQLKIVENNIQLICYYVPYSHKSDNDCARNQIHKIMSLFYHYFIDRKNESRDEASNDSKHFIHILSFDGLLVVSNLLNKIKSNKNHFFDLYKDILRINGINNLRNDIKESSNVFFISIDMNNIKETINFESYRSLSKAYAIYLQANNVLKNDPQNDNFESSVRSKALDVLNNLYKIFSLK